MYTPISAYNIGVAGLGPCVGRTRQQGYSMIVFTMTVFTMSVFSKGSRHGSILSECLHGSRGWLSEK